MWGMAGFAVFFIGAVWVSGQLYGAGYLSYESRLGSYFIAFVLVPSVIALTAAVLGLTYRPRTKARPAAAGTTARDSTPPEASTKAPQG